MKNMIVKYPKKDVEFLVDGDIDWFPKQDSIDNHSCPK
jgi:hypothetical protein